MGNAANKKKLPLLEFLLVAPRAVAVHVARRVYLLLLVLARQFCLAYFAREVIVVHHNTFIRGIAAGRGNAFAAKE